MHSIRPPEYFPGLPFWALLLACDEVVLADDFQYSRQSFQNRARLKTPNGWQWITVPLKGGGRGYSIAEVEIDNSVPWRGKHLRALQYNYRSTPYFESFEDRFIEFFDQDWETLGSLTVTSIGLVCDILGLQTPDTASTGGTAGDQSRELILDSDRADGGAAILEFEPAAYPQNFEGFESGLSVLDLLFNVGFEAIDRIRSGIRVMQ
jgi:hypothetical protein